MILNCQKKTKGDGKESGETGTRVLLKDSCKTIYDLEGNKILIKTKQVIGQRVKELLKLF